MQDYKPSRRKFEFEKRSAIKGFVFLICFIFLCGFVNWVSKPPEKEVNLNFSKEAFALTLFIHAKDNSWNIGNPNCYPKNKYSPK